MKISVIIPCYNCEKFISETLDCLLNQTLKDIQIIVVNDGSKDNSGKIIDEYALRNPNILPVHQENAGVSAARNNGMTHATGKYTLFLDGDDLIGGNDALENIYNSLEETNSDLAIFRVMRFGYGGEEYAANVDKIAADREIDWLDKRLLWNFLVSNKCYRTDLLRESGVKFPPMRYSEDGAFFMEFIHTAKPKITGVFGATMKYRRRAPEEGQSVTQCVSVDLLRDFCKSYDSAYESAKDAPEDYRQELIYKSSFSLVNEFYRLLWRGDNEALALMGERYRQLVSMMDDEALRKCRFTVKDMGELVFDKAEIAEKPFVSVVAKNCTPEFINSLYAQSMPLFELITTQNSSLPKHENIRFSPAKSKGKITVKVSGKKALDVRFLKVVSLLKKSRKFGFLPDFIIVFGAKILLKIKK